MAAYVGGPRPDVDKIRGKLDQEARDKVMGCRTKGQGECHTATHIDGAARFRGDVLGLPSRFVPRCEVFGCDRAERLRCGRCGECAAGAAAPATASTRSSRRGKARVTPRRPRCAAPARSDPPQRAPPGEGAGLMVGVRRGWG